MTAKQGKTTFVGTHEEITEKYLTLLDYAQDDSWDLAMMTETRNLPTVTL